MKKTLLMGAATALMFMTSNAVAGGTPGFAAPNWTGFYVGLGVGGGFATHDLSAKDVLEQQNGGVVQVLNAETIHLHNGDGRFFGTVTLGYDQLVSPHWLAGAFVDYDFGNRDNDSRIAAIGPFTDIHVSNGNNHAWSIGGRLGFLSSPSTLLYVSAGWTQISVEGDLSVTVDDTQFTRSFDRDRNGWFVGAGIETQLGWLGSNWSLRGEYRFSSSTMTTGDLPSQRDPAWQHAPAPLGNALNWITTSMFTRCALCWSTNSGLARRPYLPR